jgi:hypothetical protein
VSSPDAPIDKRRGIDAIFDASTTSLMLRPKLLALPVTNQTLDTESSVPVFRWSIAVWAPRKLGEISSALHG